MAHRTSGVMAIFFGLILAAIPAFAHHSLNAEFQMGKPTELKGTLTKVEWDNPHVYWDVDVKDAERQRGALVCRGTASELLAPKRCQPIGHGRPGR